MLRGKEYLSPVWSHLTEMIVDRAEGCYLYTTDGRRLLDFTSGFGVTNTGHCHPRVVKAIQEQAARLLHGQMNLIYHPAVLQLADRLHQILPPHLDQFFFIVSGAEAVEAAVKLVRHATGRPNLIAFQNGFHGRTGTTLSLTTSKAIHRQGYQPLMAGVSIAPFPYAYFYGWDEEEASAWCLRQLRHVLHTQTAPAETAAIIIEPVLGDGGHVPAPLSFLRGVREVCDEFGILLIFDEIQSGWGRSGKLFAYQYAEGVEPDVLVMGKGVASGLPLSAIAAPAALMEKWLKGGHGGTFCGNAVTCAAALATIDVIVEEKLVENAARRGEQSKDLLSAMQKEIGFKGEARGRGLIMGVELSRPDGSPDPETVRAVEKACLERQMLVAPCGPYGNIFRWAPPLVVSESQIEEGVAIFRDGLLEVLRQKRIT